MDKTEIKKLYRKAIDKWGITLQLGMLMEECAELIQATNKVMQKGNQSVIVWRDLAEEIADVKIMIEQIEFYYKFQFVEKIEKAKHNKLLRLREILNKDDV